MPAKPVIISFLLVAVAVMMGATAGAVPPSPEAREYMIREGTWDQTVAILKAFEESLPPDFYETGRALHLDRYRSSMALSDDAVDTVRVCVILVDFPDFHYDQGSYSIPSGGTLNCYAAGTPQMFDSMLFSEQGVDPVYNPTGSMTEFYLENSYGSYYVHGDVFGWYTAPQNYSYYVGENNGMGGGAILARDAVIAADMAGVDFSPYGNGGPIVPGVIIIHAGPGAEQVPTYGIWSHASNMATYNPLGDGVSISRYTMQPEERSGENSIVHVGVFCHEWGHVLGAPDYYDYNYGEEGSEGLGNWCVMAGGSWNQNGRRPAHFNGWSKYQDVGFIDIQVLTQNIRHAPIPQIETSPVAYLLKDVPPPGAGGEMWIVENRQRVGFDQSLPGSGLLIYHLDPMGHQTNPYRYFLAVEEADGRRDLAFTPDNSGDNGDPFPGFMINNRNFHDHTTPDSRTNEDGSATQVSVLNISDSDSMMYADLGVFYAMPWLVLAGDSLTVTDNAPGGDGDGIFVQGETVDIFLEVRNLMMLTYWPILHLDADDPGLEILGNDQYMGMALNPATVNNVNTAPIRVHIPDDFTSSIVKFTFTVYSDSAIATHDRSFTNTFEFELALGRTQILLVDDDNNYGDDPRYVQVLQRLGLPFEHWDKAANGSPTYEAVSQYPTVMWMTGSYWPSWNIPGGTITAADVTYMKELLDNGGNLLLASPSAPVQLQTLDSAFMADYLHASLAGSDSRRWFLGEADNPVGGGLLYTTWSGVVWDENVPTFEPTDGGHAAFRLTQYGSGDYGTCGVTYDGTFRTIFLSFGIEYLEDNRAADGYAPKDSLIMRALRFFARGAATDVEDDADGQLLPTEFALDQNYPNPFNPSTTMTYRIAAGRELTRLMIYNVLGQQVATLVDAVQGPGEYTVEWQGRDDRGTRVASGVYFYRLTHGNQADTKKMVLLK